MKTFLCEYIHEKARRELASFSEVLEDWGRIGEADALISRNLSITEEVLESAVRLRLIAVHGTGVDGVDLSAAERRGIRVVAAPHKNAASVAELNIALMFSAARKFSMAQRVASQGQSVRDSDVARGLCGTELSGKTVAFLGFGEIARRTADICRNGFSMRVRAWSRGLTAERAAECSVEYAGTIEEAVRGADVVVLGMALCDETRGILGERRLAAMKPGAFLINTARAGLVDERALYARLADGGLAGAALDVWSDALAGESAPDLPPAVRDRLFLTPHIGANTEEALYRVGMACVEQIRAWKETEWGRDERCV